MFGPVDNDGPMIRARLRLGHRWASCGVHSRVSATANSRVSVRGRARVLTSSKDIQILHQWSSARGNNGGKTSLELSFMTGGRVPVAKAKPTLGMYHDDMP